MNVTHTPVFSKSGQAIYRFPNGYGASLITNWMAHGGREMAVIRFDSESIESYSLVYDTPVTSDVLGYLSPEDVDPLLDQIAALPDPAEVSA